MDKQYSNPLPTIDVLKKKTSIFGTLRKTIAILLGVIGLVVAAIMVLTIIGILPGIGLGIVSIFIFVFALDFYHVKCPSCEKKINITEKKEDFKCPRCGQPTIINWIDKE